jgi:ribosome-associated protein
MRTFQFELTAEFIELNKLLKYLGVAESGGAAKALVASGAVSVDGAVELRKACKIREGQTVQTGDVTIAVLAPNPKG